MATKYLLFSDLATAKAQSRADWQAVLGRPKNPNDVTEFLWGTRIHPTDPTKVLGVIPDSILSMVPAARQALLVDATNPAVASVLSAIDALMASTNSPPEM